MQPIVLGANMPDTFYRGAGRIGRLRGVAFSDKPEDWVASTTTRIAQGTDGMTRLADGSLLADAIAADPDGWLGSEHVARYGPDTALLVKLLDAGQRLPVHVHPGRAFAAKHLASPYGKTEAWVIIEAAPNAAVYLGFSREVPASELARWVRDQDIESMLGATNRVPVSAGDSILCPAGTPHAIGEGILVVELQEPTDFSLILEWRDFGLGPDDVAFGLPMDEALGCVNRQAFSAARLDALRGRPLNQAAGSLLPGEADPFFIAERVTGGSLSASYGVLIVTSGSGTLTTESGSSVPLRRGSTVVIPFAAGRCTLDGTLQAVRCLPATP